MSDSQARELVPSASSSVASPQLRGFRDVQRQLASLRPDDLPLPDEGVPLEVSAAPAAPRLIAAAVIEDGQMRARRVTGDVSPVFIGFLDGTQTSHVIRHVHGLPIVHGTVAAAIRVRRERRLSTWDKPIVQSRIYASRRLLPADWNDTLDQIGVPVIDTSERHEAGSSSVHPFAVRDECVHAVQDDREAAERVLAERWCGADQNALFIDGGISGSERVARSACAIGVIKSHRTLYAEGNAMRLVLGLRRGERSSVFRVTSPKRTTVASWYLRLRDPVAHDPMWALVRVEAAEPTSDSLPAIAERADEVSRWILAEASPLSLPDRRWDKLAYGVHDCEQFLKAVM